MTLFEIKNGYIGESDVRCYVWAPDQETAEKIYREQYPDHAVHEIRALFHSGTATFITKLSDNGWEL